MSVTAINYKIFIDDILIKECYTLKHCYKYLGIKKSSNLERYNCRIIKEEKYFKDLDEYIKSRG